MWCSAAGGSRPPPGRVPAIEEAPGAGLAPRKVLVVDDERDLADLAGALLGGHGIEARVAYCAHEALQVLEADPDIDAVFSDVMMPGMNGLQLAETIRYLYPSVKIVLTSGYTAPALVAGHRSCPYAAKPYRIETVIELLRS